MPLISQTLEAFAVANKFVPLKEAITKINPDELTGKVREWKEKYQDEEARVKLLAEFLENALSKSKETWKDDGTNSCLFSSTDTLPHPFFFVTCPQSCLP